MENQQITPAQTALNFGIILGAYNIIVGIMLYFLEMHYQNDQTVGIINIVITVVIIMAGIIQFKNRLKSVTIEELESVDGIGSKTSRFFTLHSRPNQQIAVLDTHILKYMASKGYKVPKSTPPKNKYGAIEEQFIQLAKDNNMSVADFDLQVWRSYSEK